jgi:hypothetical protein
MGIRYIVPNKSQPVFTGEKFPEYLNYTNEVYRFEIEIYSYISDVWQYEWQATGPAFSWHLSQ